MNKTPKNLPAELVISKFGGLRPLAKRINVAPSTVQGWRQRGVVPSTKVPYILQAADEDGIELFESQARANENDADEENQPSAPQAGAPSSDLIAPPADDKRTASRDRRKGQDRRQKIDPNYEGVERRRGDRRSGLDRRQQRQLEWVHKKRFIDRWVLTFGIILFLLISVSVFLFAPEYIAMKERSEGYVALENRVKNLNQEVSRLTQSQGSLSGKISQQIERFQKGQGNVSQRLNQVEETARDLANRNWVERSDLLQQKLGSLTGAVKRAEVISETPEGQAALSNSLDRMNQSLNDPEANPDQVVEDLRRRDPAFGAVMRDVEGSDLKAAAILLTMNRIRSAQGRGQAPFAEDLEAVKKLAGDDPETLAAIESLAPYAKNGVLSQEGLSKEFKGLAGDIVMAKLRGEDASVKDRALSRLSALGSVRKIDELEGDSEDAVVARAQLLLDSGDVAGAIRELETLEGASAETAAPWINEAKKSLLANHATNNLSNSVITKMMNGHNLSPDGMQTVIKGLMRTGNTTGSAVMSGAQSGDVEGLIRSLKNGTTGDGLKPPGQGSTYNGLVK